MHTTLALVATMILAGPPAQQPAAGSQGGDLRISECFISVIQELNVPAREAGELTELIATEGMLVQEGDLLGQIDDKDAQARLAVATAEKGKADYLANTTASVDAARATAEVAKAEMEQTAKINEILDDAISQFDLRRRKLTFERSTAELTIADIQHSVDTLDVQARAAQLEAVQNEIKRRRIESPINGVVEKKLRNKGEWVNLGDPIYHVVQMDRLKVETLVNARIYAPEQILGRPVQILVEMPGPTGAPRRTEVIEAKITFASPVISSSGLFRVKTEFDNPVRNGHWLVRPGQPAEMIIDLP